MLLSSFRTCFVLVVLLGLLQLGDASRRWSEGWDNGEDDGSPSAAFWVVVGVAGAVALVLIVMLIWYCCYPTPTAVMGTPSGGAYSAVLQNIQSSPQPMLQSIALFTPSGTPITASKRE
jgi:hypothetical protein